MGDCVQVLKAYLYENPAFRLAFEESFQIALRMGIPQFAEYNIKTFDDYINFYELFLKWTPSENTSGTNVYNHLCLFYFVIDLPPVKLFQTPILPSSVPPWTWLSDWLVTYANEMGTWMDTPESINPTTLATFYTAPIYHMQDYPVPPGSWKTFNDFFARHIDPNVRPIDKPDDPTVIVSPADSHFDGWWPVNSDNKVVLKHLPWDIDELLQDSEYGEMFKGGKFMHAFLSTWDYHRQHAPVAGTVKEAKVIQGVCYLEVIAENDENGRPKLNMRRQLDAPDSPGYQFMQARGLVVLDNPDIGLVAVLPIGMAQVSSVRLSVQPGQVVAKGDEITYFQLGGSDIVVVFQAASNVDITAGDKHYNVGQQIATAQVINK